MKSISIDVETYSSVNLQKSGVYRYCESDDFEILLFGYSVDGGEVQVVDLAGGEKIPIEIINALTDDSVIKSAFNAQFERVCLSKWLGMPAGTYLSPKSWHCTMVWSAALGLPLSLEGVGAVLGLEKQKLSEGKNLIKYFCIPCSPTKSNGGRTRNLPRHDTEKWEMFTSYNKRDVETEMAIKNKLSKFPVSKTEWQNYNLDQIINDLGITLDMDFVRQAISCDEKFKTENIEKAKELTGLENPNSPAQLKNWLLEQGMETDSLSKAVVSELLEDSDGEIREVLSIRQQLAKSSVKKYTAMKNVVCSDNRARGLIQFYGANRTGRYCLTGDHEVLSENGWIRLDEWNGGRIACWNPIGEKISFQESKPLSFLYKGIMYEYTDKRISQVSTPEHKMYVKKRYGGEWQIDTVENMAKYRPSIPFTGYRQTNPGMEHNYLRVLVMVQADGHFTNEGNIRLIFSKERKVARCKELLRVADIMYSLKVYHEYDKMRYQFTIYSRHVPMWLRMFQNKTFGPWLLDESADVFFNELVYWDGYRSAKNSIQYTTCNKKNADITQAFAHLSGRTAQMKIKTRKDKHPNWNDAYILDIWLTPKNCHEIKSKPILNSFDGNVYCAETPTGFFIVRRNGRVWITGNSGRLIQVQNLPQNHLPDLKQARSLVKSRNFTALDLLYDSIPNVLSELIRTAFIPRYGSRFIVADFSAIEARVIAWLAGESWRMDVFAGGGDIYCASASKMFNVSVEKNGINGHLRQKGKIAELALGYGGSVGALKAMGAIQMGLVEDELQPLVNAWRNSNPNITSLWWGIDYAVKTVIKTKQPVEIYGIWIFYQSGILFIKLPSGRELAYVKPLIGENRFGGESVTYEGVGGTKKWERIESYGAKFVENIVQAISRDILAEAMLRLAVHGFQIVMHVHDEVVEVVIEAPDKISFVEEVCRIMSETPAWAKGLILNADGYECELYKKE